jgi:hypothetical protein
MSARLVARAVSTLVLASMVLVAVLGAGVGTAGARFRSAPSVGVKTGGFVPRVGPLRVALYGDSLAFEAQDHFVAAVTATGQAEVRTGTYGGTAICDWLDQMRRDAAEWRPQFVVVEFSGNALTPCMKDGDGRPLADAAYWDRYATDARTVVEIFSAVRARVFFAGSPISRAGERSGDFNGGQLNALYATIAGAQYIDAGAAVLDRGHYAEALPCRADEPCIGADGTNVVRAPDGAHFCPGGDAARDGVTGACTVWSSGAWRYGRALAAPAVARLGR